MRLVLVGLLGLAACNQSPQQIQANQAEIQNAIVSACGEVQKAMALAAPFAAVPQVGAVMDYGAAACIGAEAVSALTTKALSDPNTITWTQNLAKTIATSAGPRKLFGTMSLFSRRWS